MIQRVRQRRDTTAHDPESVLYARVNQQCGQAVTHPHNHPLAGTTRALSKLGCAFGEIGSQGRMERVMSERTRTKRFAICFNFHL
ncbi:MAG: hypothetical protein AAFY88_06325 [Acidobacteriota bacterium]